VAFDDAAAHGQADAHPFSLGRKKRIEELARVSVPQYD
jgi:hypothetical protein